jgi:uncharacterized membrane protein
MLTWTPIIAAHAAAAAIALPVGALALLARRGTRLHRALGPRLHKTLGHAWVLLMLATALTSVFIRDFALPNIAGYTPIHLFTVFTLVMVPLAVWLALRGRFALHRRIMISTYIGAGVVAGLFTLLPERLIGRWLWGEVIRFDAGTLALARGVLQGTPSWVFVLLPVLLAVGLAQMRARQVGPLRVQIFPLAMLGLAAVGVLGAFGAGLAALAWLASVIALLPLFSRLPLTRGVTWQAQTRQFSMPSSPVPLLVILGIFALKFSVGVMLGLHPGLAHDDAFALPVAAGYGVINALLAARGWMLWRLTRAGASVGWRPSPVPVA